MCLKCGFMEPAETLCVVSLFNQLLFKDLKQKNKTEPDLWQWSAERRPPAGVSLSKPLNLHLRARLSLWRPPEWAEWKSPLRITWGDTEASQKVFMDPLRLQLRFTGSAAATLTSTQLTGRWFWAWAAFEELSLLHLFVLPSFFLGISFFFFLCSLQSFSFRLPACDLTGFSSNKTTIPLQRETGLGPPSHHNTHTH